MPSIPPIPTVKESFENLTKQIWTPAFGPVSQIQRQETERAFYAGAAAMFYALSIGVGALNDDVAAEKRLDEFDKELKDYFAL